MADVGKLVRQAAEKLGFQPAKGITSRYLGVTKLKSLKWQARTGGVSLGLFDLEIEAALAVRKQQLQNEGKDAEAKLFENVRKALASMGSSLAVRCGCGKDGGKCDCNEKALREVESAKAAWEALKAVSAGGVLPVAPAPAPKAASADPQPKAAPAEIASQGAAAASKPARAAKQPPAPAQPAASPGSASKPAPPASKAKTTPSTSMPSALRRPLLQGALESNKGSEKTSEAAATPVVANPQWHHDRIAAMRREHELARRRQKERRRAERLQELQKRLEKRMKCGEGTEEGAAPAAEDERAPKAAEEAEVAGLGAEYSDLRAQFLSKMRMKKKKVRKMRIVRLEDYGKLRALTYWDAVERLKQIAAEAKARARRMALHPSTGDNGSFWFPDNPHFTFDPSMFNPRITGFPFAVPPHDTSQETHAAREKRFRDMDLALKRLTEQRRAAQAHEAAEMAAAETELEEKGTKAAAKGSQEPGRSDRIEWLLLQRVEPKAFLAGMTLTEEERLAQQEEQKLFEAWEAEGGREEEEALAKEWRMSQRVRRQNDLLRRGAARWIRGARRSTAGGEGPTERHGNSPAKSAKGGASAGLQEAPEEQLQGAADADVPMLATEDPYL